ncbi:hypothetical protein L873DRAFT_1062982 [Choiromyces venosus 120613-1]|uniref:Uncharacterized protein n=1 Tax=Choiromyces venosus 120613-1 TaxID=1336337 RepID=A0A3N4JIG1_9PEZI|nr:hypothetical protein L873DRAFT_1062982 [Choiromyces venosus 120613-1]
MGSKATGDASGHSLTAARSIAPSTGPLDRGTPPGTERGYRSRPLTSHQLAVQQNRRDRAEYLINRKLKRLDRKSRKARLQEGAISRCWRRIKHMEDPFAKSDDEHEVHPVKPIIRSTPAVVAAPPATTAETDDAGNAATTAAGSTEGNNKSTDSKDPATVANPTTDSPTEPMDIDSDLPPVKKIKTEHVNNEHHSSKRYGNGTAHRGIAGLAPTDAEEDDYGEEALALAAAIRRSKRRLERWDEEDARRALGEDVVVGRRGSRVVEDSEEDGDGEGDAEGEMEAEEGEGEGEAEGEGDDGEGEGDAEGDAEGEEDGEGEEEEAEDEDVEME